MHVAEVQADRGRLEHEPAAVVQHGNSSERMARMVLLAGALLRRDRGQLVRLAELLEHPHDPDRASGVLSVEDPHPPSHDTVWPQPGRSISGGTPDVLELGEGVGVEPQIARRHVLLQVSQRRCPGDQQHVGTACQQPREPDL